MEKDGLFHSKNYITIQGWMVTDMKLGGNELVLYAIIYGFSQDGSTKCFAALKYFQSAMSCSRNTVMSCLKSLEELGYIEKHEEYTNGVKFNKYSAIYTKANHIAQGVQKLDGGCNVDDKQGVQKLDEGCAEIGRGGVQELDGGGAISAPYTDRYISIDKKEENKSSSGENFSELVFSEFRKQKPDLPQTALIDEVNLFEKKFKGQTIGNLTSLVQKWCEKVDWSRYSQPPENSAPAPERKPLDLKEATDTVKELNPNLTPMQCYDIAAKIHRRFGDKKYDNPKQFVIDTITQMQRPDYVEKVTMTYHAILSEIKYLTKGATDGWQRYVADKVYETWKDKPVQSFEELMESFVYDAKNKRNLFAAQ